MSEMLHFSDWEFKRTIINMLRVLINRKHARTEGQRKQRSCASTPKTDAQRNVRDQCYSKRNEECLWWDH